MNGKEIGVCTSTDLSILPSKNKEDTPKKFKQNCSFTVKPNKQTAFFLDRPFRIKKYIKQILRQ